MAPDKHLSECSANTDTHTHWLCLFYVIHCVGQTKNMRRVKWSRISAVLNADDERQLISVLNDALPAMRWSVIEGQTVCVCAAQSLNVRNTKQTNFRALINRQPTDVVASRSLLLAWFCWLHRLSLVQVHVCSLFITHAACHLSVGKVQWRH